MLKCLLDPYVLQAPKQATIWEQPNRGGEEGTGLSLMTHCNLKVTGDTSPTVCGDSAVATRLPVMGDRCVDQRGTTRVLGRLFRHLFSPCHAFRERVRDVGTRWGGFT
eukprot:TRINITY_DN193_c2_g1_i15.p2 TRINITY_DN193_c2_g1~~TRINITY_DN193_c2_g1_i15.p2  ORF type:complete len:108 (-),score=0.32 TRINITY_DN193_c2_g1_i15:15-338(-)